MVAARRFLLERVICLHLLGRAPGGAVDALQHWARLVAAPVRAGDRLQVDGLGVDLLRGLDVRTRAQVPPLVADVVDGDGLRLDRFQNLELVRLVDGADAALRLFAGHFLATQRVILVDDLDHLLLDGLQVLVCGFRKGGGFGQGPERERGDASAPSLFLRQSDASARFESSRRSRNGRVETGNDARRAESDRACATRGGSAASRRWRRTREALGVVEIVVEAAVDPGWVRGLGRVSRALGGSGGGHVSCGMDKKARANRVWRRA